MLDWITHTIASSGYLGILLLMVLENILPPIPSEIIMPLAGFTVEQGKLNFVAVVLAGSFGSVLGALPWYYVGKRVGEKQLRRWVNRYGKWLTLAEEDVDRSKHWFRKYGGAVVFFGRLIPGVRTYISIPAGLEEMQFAPFLLYSALGSLLWVGLLTYAGYLLGQNYQLIKDYLSPVATIAPIVVLLGCIFWGVYRFQKQKNKK